MYLAVAESSAAEWWQVAVGTLTCVTTGVLAFLAWRTSRDAAATAKAAGAAETERVALAERMAIAADIVELHNAIGSIESGSSSSTPWWDKEARVRNAVEIKGWTEVSALWEVAREARDRSNSEYRGQFKDVLYQWVYAPERTEQLAQWVKEERARRGFAPSTKLP